VATKVMEIIFSKGRVWQGQWLKHRLQNQRSRL